MGNIYLLRTSTRECKNLHNWNISFISGATRGRKSRSENSRGKFSARKFSRKIRASRRILQMQLDGPSFRNARINSVMRNRNTSINIYVYAYTHAYVILFWTSVATKRQWIYDRALDSTRKEIALSRTSHMATSQLPMRRLLRGERKAD